MTAATYDQTNNEGGDGYNPLRHSTSAMMEQHRRAMALKQQFADAAAAFEAEWTLETTQARRAAWNAAVQAGEMSTAGKVDPRKVEVAIARLGYSLADVRRAVALHKLG